MLNEKRSSMLHGILLIALFSLAAFYLGDMTWATQLSISPMIIGILLGMLYANSLRNNLPETWVPGITFCAKRILRIGIILYGFRLTLQDVTAVGMPAIVPMPSSYAQPCLAVSASADCSGSTVASPC